LTARPRGWQRIVRWGARLVGATIALAVLAIGATLFALHTDWGRARLRRAVESGLAGALGGPVHIAALEGSVLGELVAREVIVDSPDGSPLLAIHTLHVELALAPLLGHVARFDRLVAEDVDVTIPAGWPGTPAPAPATPPRWDVELRQIEVSRAHVLVGLAPGKAIELTGITISGEARLHAGDAGPSGRATVRAAWPAGGLPGLALAGSVVASLNVLPGGMASGVAAVSIAGSTLVAGVLGDLPGRGVSGAVFAPTLELGAVTAGRASGQASAGVGFALTLPRDAGVAGLAGEAVVAAAGVVDGLAIDGAIARVAVTAGSAHVAGWLLADDACAAVTADVALGEHGPTLSRAHASVAGDARGLSGGGVIAAGPITGELDASGPLWPAPDLLVSGELAALQPRAGDLTASRVRARFVAHGVPSDPAGTATIIAAGARRGSDALGDLLIDVEPAGAHRFAVVARSVPPATGWALDAAGHVTLGDVIRIELDRHRLIGPGQRWTGAGGTVEISETQVVVRGLRSAGPTGALALASARVARAAQPDLAIAGSASGIDLASATRLLGMPTGWSGSLDAHIAVERRAGRWSGTATAAARQLVQDASAPPIDAHISLALSRTRLALDVDAAAPALGRATLSLETVPPARVDDLAAWQRTTRSAIRSAHATFAELDLAAIGRVAHLALPPGHLEGDLTIAGEDLHGALHARGVELDVRGKRERLDGDVTLAATGDHIVATAGASALGIAVSGHATLSPPEHLFDPAAWQRLDARQLRDAQLRLPDAALEAVLAALALPPAVTGRVAATVDLADLASGARFEIDLSEVRGGLLVRPVDARLAGTVRERDATVDLLVRSATIPLLALRAAAPVELTALATRGRAALAGVPVLGCVTLAATSSPGPDCRAGAPVSLATLLALVGRTDATGTIDGALSLDGTLDAPRVTGRVAAHDVRGRTVIGEPTPVMRELAVSGTTDGRTLDLVASAATAPGHTLRVTARGPLGATDQLELAVTAERFDLGPLAAFVPGPLGGAGGVIDGTLEQHGLDPELGGLHGKLQITDARMPIAPSIGTVQHAAIALAVERGRVAFELDGRLGAGRVRGHGSASLSSADTTSADATIELRHVSPIGTVQPIVDARIVAGLRRVAGRWRATLAVHDGAVTVPEERGAALHPVGVPPDLVFGDPAAIGLAQAGAPARRQDPAGLIVVLDLDPMHVVSPQFRGDVGGALTIQLGDGMTLDGSLTASSSDVDLLGRRYVVERAAVHFDGSADPLLDIALSYAFPETTLYARIGGRLSKPDVILTSDPASYSQDQLFGFFLGGSPGVDPSNKALAVSGAAAGAASSLVNVVVNRVLPPALRGNVQLRYETATATSSAAVVIGLWLSRRVFVAGRSRSNPLPVVENGGEADLEWWLGGNWMLQSTFGDRSVGGADLLWHRSW